MLYVYKWFAYTPDLAAVAEIIVYTEWLDIRSNIAAEVDSEVTNCKLKLISNDSVW